MRTRPSSRGSRRIPTPPSAVFAYGPALRRAAGSWYRATNRRSHGHSGKRSPRRRTGRDEHFTSPALTAWKAIRMDWGEMRTSDARWCRVGHRVPAVPPPPGCGTSPASLVDENADEAIGAAHALVVSAMRSAARARRAGWRPHSVSFSAWTRRRGCLCRRTRWRRARTQRRPVGSRTRRSTTSENTSVLVRLPRPLCRRCAPTWGRRSGAGGSGKVGAVTCAD